MHLYDVWFIAIAILFIGYFFLEGFDFGVGILVLAMARGETERRVLINTIAPVWDGNEVWVVTAAGAMFAAFPEWYASLFSAVYLPLLLILLALIVRGVAFEYRGKRDSAQWRRRWDHGIFWGSLIPAVLWGVVFGNVVHGLRLDHRHLYVGSLLDLVNLQSLLGGATTLSVFVVHGCFYVALKTTGELRDRAYKAVLRVGPAAALAGMAFLGLTIPRASNSLGLVATLFFVLLAGASGLAALAANQVRSDGWAFGFSCGAISLATATLFVALYPYVLPSTLHAGYGLTVSSAAATPRTLGIMTWVAVVFLPLVLAYQGWTYWVFRRRIGVRDIPA